MAGMGPGMGGFGSAEAANQAIAGTMGAGDFGGEALAGLGAMGINAGPTVGPTPGERASRATGRAMANQMAAEAGVDLGPAGEIEPAGEGEGMEMGGAPEEGD